MNLNEVFRLKVHSNDLEAIVAAIKFINLTILKAHPHSVYLSRGKTNAEILEITHDFIEGTYDIVLNEDDYLVINDKVFTENTKVVRMEIDFYAHLEVIRNALALQI